MIKSTAKFLLVILTIFGLLTFATIKADCEEVQEVRYQQALVEVWTMPGCSPCQWVKTYAVPEWKKSAKVFVIDYTKYGTAAQRKGITAYPTIIVYNPDKREVDRFTSGRPYSGDSLTRAVQASINKVNKSIMDNPPKKSEGGIDACAITLPKEPVNEGVEALGNIFGWQDEDGDDEPIGDEEEPKSPSPNKDRKSESPRIGSPNLDSVIGPAVERATGGIKERIEELIAEVKSSVMQAAIIGSLIAMVIYAVLKTMFSGAFVLAKAGVVKMRNWICNSVAGLATNIASKVAEQQAKK